MKSKRINSTNSALSSEEVLLTNDNNSIEFKHAFEQQEQVLSQLQLLQNEYSAIKANEIQRLIRNHEKKIDSSLLNKFIALFGTVDGSNEYAKYQKKHEKLQGTDRMKQPSSQMIMARGVIPSTSQRNISLINDHSTLKRVLPPSGNSGAQKQLGRINNWESIQLFEGNSSSSSTSMLAPSSTKSNGRDSSNSMRRVNFNGFRITTTLN